MGKNLDNSTSSFNSTDPTLYSSSLEETASVLAASVVKAEANPPRPPPTMSKTVGFQSVEIAQYPMELGDNPSASGLPISIGWECDFKLNFELEEYETSKPAPRSRDQFWMPPQYREQVLSKQGVTASEMLRTTKEMKRIKKSRHRSIRNKRWDKLNFFMEESGRQLKKITSVTSISKIPLSSHKNLSSPSDELEDSSPDKLGGSSFSSSVRRRSHRSMSMSMMASIMGSDDGSRDSRDILDESRKSRIAMHLIKHPEEVLMEDDDELNVEETSGDVNLIEDVQSRIQAVEDMDDSPLYDQSIEF